jgi:hypothetical protein
LLIRAGRRRINPSFELAKAMASMLRLRLGTGQLSPCRFCFVWSVWRCRLRVPFCFVWPVWTLLSPCRFCFVWPVWTLLSPCRLCLCLLIWSKSPLNCIDTHRHTKGVVESCGSCER